jgi:hypothetical protein
VRTVQDFVEDMFSDCRNLKDILIVAFCTRWKDRLTEVKKEYQRLIKRRRFKTNERKQAV